MGAVNKRKVFLLAGHAHGGKTSLAEVLLYKTKMTSRLGKVEDGTTASDYQEDEIERRSSISASLLMAKYKEYELQFFDAPGYLDFIGDVISAARGVDFMVIVVDAVAGVEVGTEKAFEIARREKLPCMFFISKLDKENTDFEKTVIDIQDSLGKTAVPFCVPEGKSPAISAILDVLHKDDRAKNASAAEYYKQIVEKVAETDDALLEKYLDKGALSDDEVLPALEKAVLTGVISPIVGGSAFADKGIVEFLDVLIESMPSADSRSMKVKDDKGTEITVTAKDPFFSAQVLKTISDPYVGNLSILRVFSGTLSANSTFYNVNKSSRERFSQLFLLQGKQQQSVESVSAGQVVAIAKLKDTATADTLTDESKKFLFPDIVFPVPAYSASVKPKTRQDEEKISQAMHRLTAEDPTFKFSRDAETKELLISGIGELHLSVMIGRMKKRFSAEVELGTPKVPYKETVTKPVKVQGRFKRQTGGRGQFGDVWIEVHPLERGKSFEFVDKVVGGAIPRNYIPSVEKGIRKTLEKGLLAGYPIVDVQVVLFDGSYHPVDSSDMAFQIAGSMALKKAFEQAHPVLLEPVMDVEITVPDEFMGQITGDINSRRGRVMGMENKGKNEVVKAQIPLSEMFKYASDLRSVTAGRGNYNMSFSHYETVPQRLSQPVIEEYVKTRKKEEDEA